jgi:hypothetical protein
LLHERKPERQKKEKNRNAGLSIFFNKPVFLYTGEQHVPHNDHKAKDTLECEQRSGGSVIQLFLFPNIHVRFWEQTITRNEVISVT